MTKTSNPFIAAACDAVGEMPELEPSKAARVPAQHPMRDGYTGSTLTSEPNCFHAPRTGGVLASPTPKENERG